MEPLAFPSAPHGLAWPDCRFETDEIALVGDIMVHGGELAAARQPDGSYSMDGWLEPVRPWLATADLTAANLETTISGEDQGGFTGYPRFNSPETLLDELHRVGVDVLQTTNNHCLDRGEIGLLRTLDEVEARGFLHAGTYRSVEDRRTPHVVATLPNGARVAFLAYTYGTEEVATAERWWQVGSIDQLAFAHEMALARADAADVVIVGLHWGREYQDAPDPEQVDLARWLVHLGADVVWGTHPHVVQPAEVVTVTDASGGARDGLILYSLGNFISNQRDPKRDGGVIARLAVTRCDAVDRTWVTDLGLVPTWVDDRDTSGRLAFRVVPTVPEVAACPGGLTDGDCERLVDHHEWISTGLFSTADVARGARRLGEPISLPFDPSPRWFRYAP